MTVLQHESLFFRLTSHRIFLISSLIIFFLIISGFFIFYPIIGYDTDLWYHLNGGRFFWDHMTIPGDAFFSYIMPQKSWYDYYWLFQAVVYQVYVWSGYYGLIILRCLLFTSTAVLISLFFFRTDKKQWGRLAGIFFVAAYPVAITLRELIIRPHLFSYLFIVLFLYILEIKRNKIWMLPFLGVLWSNIHGIEYPVMIMILLAYLIEIFYRDARKVSPDEITGKKEKWFIIATIYTIFCTPYIYKLIETPFSAAKYQQWYVAELIPIQIGQLLNFSLYPFSGFINLFQNVIISATVIFFIISFFKKSIRVSHILIFIVSWILLLKHNRFIYEFILLSLPIVRHGLDLSFKPEKLKTEKISLLACIPVILMLVIVPVVTYGSNFKNRPEYPVTQAELPFGVALFLNHLNEGGSVMNEPNTGGYLQWALDKKYKIFMDMQMSVFSDQDFAFINHALHDEPTFRAFIKKYDPSFISVSLDRNKFRKVVDRHQEYKQIFFDDEEVLYVNTRHYPQIAEQYALKQLNVFEYKDIKYEKETKERLDALLSEALKVRNIYPGCGIANVIIANIMMANKQYGESLGYADSFIKHYPNIAKGYILKADALRGLERVPEAIQNYLAAIEKGLKNDETRVYWNLHTCYGHLKMYDKAYDAMIKFINPFNPEANYRDIYALGISAATAGKKKDAVNFLKIAQFKVPPEDGEYTNKVKFALDELKPGSVK